MKCLISIALIVSTLPLAGCGPSQSALQAQMAAVQADNKILQERVTQLEARVQAIEASLPEDAGAQSN